MTKVFITSSTSYRIEKDNVEIFATEKALATIDEVLVSFGLKIETESIFKRNQQSKLNGLDVFCAIVSDDESMLNVQNDINVDEIIAVMNDEIKPRHNMHYNSQNNDELEVKLEVDNKSESNQYVPVGSVDRPKIGDLIYIDGMKSILRTILGGVATVSAIHDTDTYVSTNEDVEEWENGQDESSEANIMFEIEEFPGTYFSWSMLRAKQADLAIQYGYKPAQLI